MQKLKNASPMKEVTKVPEKEVVQEEENLKEDDIEQEKKKLRRRKKKYGSEDPEEINVAHRIIIWDDQVNCFFSLNDAWVLEWNTWVDLLKNQVT